MRTMTKWIVALVAAALPAVASAQTVIPETTLSAAVTADATRIPVASATDADVGDFLYIDMELMRVTAISGTNLTVRRGEAGGQRGARHASGARVWVAPAGAFRAGPQFAGGSCVATEWEYAPYIDAETGRIWDCEQGLWMERSNDPVFVRSFTVRDSFDQGYTIMQDDGTAKSVTDDEDNFVEGSPLGAIEYREELGKTTSSWITATGILDISADNTVDNEGVEIIFGASEADGIQFIAGTTGMCIAASIDIADISGTDQVQIGFRDNAAFADAAAYAGYTIWNTVGVNATDGSIVSSQEVSEATDTDDSAVNWADGETRALKVCVSKAGVPTAYYSDAYTHSQTLTDYPTYNAIVMTETGGTLTAAQAMFSTFSYLAAGTDGADVTINWVELTWLP